MNEDIKSKEKEKEINTKNNIINIKSFIHFLNLKN